MKRETYSLRLDPEIIKFAKSSGANISQILESTLRAILNQEKCPVCNQKIKNDSKRR